MKLFLVVGCALAAMGQSPSECDIGGGTMKPLGWKGVGIGADWCSTCYCHGNGVANAAKVCRKTCAAVPLKCCAATGVPAQTTTTHSCCGLTGEWTIAGANAECKHVTLPFAPALAAPFAPACTGTCTVDGAAVPVGWEGHQSGANWCNKCACTATGLKCQTATCQPAKCCAGAPPGPATARCCGATGLWVDVGATCSGVALATAGAGPAFPLPYTTACQECTIPDTPTDITVKAGWFGKVRCNNCYCSTAGVLTCTTKKCDCDFSKFNADATGVTRQYVQTGFVGYYSEGPGVCTTQTCTGPGKVTEATGIADTAGCPVCNFGPSGADRYAVTHAWVKVGFTAIYTSATLGMCDEKTCTIAAPLTGATTAPTREIECPKTCDFTAYGASVIVGGPGPAYTIVNVGFSAFYTGAPCTRRQCADAAGMVTEVTGVTCPA